MGQDGKRREERGEGKEQGREGTERGGYREGEGSQGERRKGKVIYRRYSTTVHT